MKIEISTLKYVICQLIILPCKTTHRIDYEDQRITDLRKKYKNVWSLIESVRPAIHRLATFNGFCAHSIMDEYVPDTEKMVNSTYNKLRGPNTIFVLQNENNISTVSVKIDLRSRRSLHNYIEEHSGDMINIIHLPSYEEEKKLTKDNVRIPPNLFSLLPEEITQFPDLKLFISRGIKLENLREIDLHNIGVLDIDSNWDKEKMKLTKSFLEMNYPHMNYKLVNSKRGFKISNYETYYDQLTQLFRIASYFEES